MVYAACDGRLRSTVSAALFQRSRYESSKSAPTNVLLRRYEQHDDCYSSIFETRVRSYAKYSVPLLASKLEPLQCMNS